MTTLIFHRFSSEIQEKHFQSSVKKQEVKHKREINRIRREKQAGAKTESGKQMIKSEKHSQERSSEKEQLFLWVLFMVKRRFAIRFHNLLMNAVALRSS